MTSTWPLQSECPAFYGNPTATPGGSPPGPSSVWEKQNLVLVPLPWHAVAAWDSRLPISSLRVHKKVQISLVRVLNALWDRAQSLNPANPQAEIARVGLDQIGGGYNWRMMRGSHALSMHSYGCAIDFDPARNAFHNLHPSFGRPDNRWVVEAFAAEGWVWGGGWKDPDGMHFQAARVA